MGVSYGSQGFILILVAVSLFALGEAKTVVVGGSQGWRYGFNYTHWTLKNGPFYIKDTLVFKYDPPSNTRAHDVYLLPNLWSYITCDFRRAKLVANATQGGGEGFKFVLNQWGPHYFACGQGANSSHCNQGLMKFFAVPWPRWHF
ncbi:unnamed protein product [Prunus armeniaca]|uniref:Phytocyanin domain-containing protein n=1 Tax=Prunus armeniaca TaxID=36596 RepID=A0A6J5TTU0_PRUAR|nr:unnamed protein product [Prunus armeniaca]CAB4296428.1 unnamed protein product [Prunus armeniaca]